MCPPHAKLAEIECVFATLLHAPFLLANLFVITCKRLPALISFLLRYIFATLLHAPFLLANLFVKTCKRLPALISFMLRYAHLPGLCRQRHHIACLVGLVSQEGLQLLHLALQDRAVRLKHTQLVLQLLHITGTPHTHTHFKCTSQTHTLTRLGSLAWHATCLPGPGSTHTQVGHACSHTQALTYTFCLKFEALSCKCAHFASKALSWASRACVKGPCCNRSMQQRGQKRSGPEV